MKGSEGAARDEGYEDCARYNRMTMASPDRRPLDPSLGRVLVVDDEAAIRFGLTRMLARRGYHVACAATASEGLAQAASFAPDLILLDLRLPDAGGLSLVRSLRRGSSSPIVIVMTGYALEETASRALREGALLVIGKPIDIDHLLGLIAEIRANARVLSDHASLRDVSDRRSLEFLGIGESAASRRLRDDVQRTADSDAPFLLLGEPGSGRLLAARAAHLRSRRSQRAFVDFPLLVLGEAALHAARQEAAGGTLLLRGLAALDAVPDLVAGAPGGEPTIRYSLAISPAADGARELEERIATLFSIRIDVPSLRDRREDILALLSRLLSEIALATGRPAPSLTLSALSLLQSYDWPGNLDELRLVAERAFLLYGAGPIGARESAALIGL
jgi:two-component system, NtrC family, nitrogen regulation response regulator NtrX